ncbi:hypothetical protein K461DRAFT_293873 [Myriangium duriaei CBS 260.36]|uniref:Uncharacterized protein n=1 Tax=Myriangium duriaei CBS 260.36 TaxID=1168546 RepID=A0A9P4MLY6_9PEZI|nr:hypothetical protein K461DRAFT_293873 [Myriangium duriaei CBS 260.36]
MLDSRSLCVSGPVTAGTGATATTAATVTTGTATTHKTSVTKFTSTATKATTVTKSRSTTKAAATAAAITATTASTVITSSAYAGICSNEGCWNCDVGTQLQGCAGDTWSTLQSMAACTVGELSTLTIGWAKQIIND